MIYKKVDSKKYREEFDKKFSNFGDKAPIVISVMPDEFGVTIVHENSGSRYFYEWDYTIPVKAFIHKIKQDLSHNHYPRICRKEIVPISAIRKGSIKTRIEQARSEEMAAVKLIEEEEKRKILEDEKAAEREKVKK